MQLLQFPFLVLQCIAEHLELYEVFTLATVSNKLKMNMKNWLCRQRFAVVYDTEGAFEIGRKISDELIVDKFQVVLLDHSYQELAYNYKLWTLLNRESVPVKVTEELDHSIAIETFWPGIAENTEFDSDMLEFIVEVFPKPIFTLHFRTQNVELVRNGLESVKKLQLKVDSVAVEPDEDAEDDETFDEFVKLVLDGSRGAETVEIECKVSDGFKYDFKTPLNFKFILVDFAQFVTKNDVINYFLDCEEVFLENAHFTDQELLEIIMAWARNPKGDVVQFFGPGDGNFYSTSLMTDVVKDIPNAVAVQKASVRFPEEYEIVKFKEGRAYTIKANDGTDAIVFKFDNGFTLTKHFRISEEINGMETDMEDGEEGEEENVDEENEPNNDD